MGLRRSTNRERGHGSAICECRAGCGGEGLTTGSRKRMKLSEYKERRRCRDFCIDSYAIRTFECFLFQVARCSCLNCRLSACIPKQVVVNRSITVQEPDVGWDYYIEFHYCTASSSADLGFLLYGCSLAARWSFQIQMRAWMTLAGDCVVMALRYDFEFSGSIYSKSFSQVTMILSLRALHFGRKRRRT